MNGQWFEYAAAVDDTRLWPWKQYAETVRFELQRSQRFYLPYGSGISTGRRFKDVADLLRLPFDVVTVLCPTDCVHKEHPAEGRRIQAMTIAISADADHSPARRYMSGLQWPANVEPWFLMFSMVKEPVKKVWVVSTGPILVCKRKDGDEVVLERFLVREQVTEELMAGGWGTDRLMAESDNDLHVVLELCLMLGLQNVKRATVQVPKGAARARVARGKTALFDYHVLEVDGERWDGAAGKGQAEHGHRSHLRRGHIRRLDAQRRVWVRACYVHGSQPGFVAKDYSLSGGTGA